MLVRTRNCCYYMPICSLHHSSMSCCCLSSYISIPVRVPLSCSSHTYAPRFLKKIKHTNKRMYLTSPHPFIPTTDLVTLLFLFLHAKISSSSELTNYSRVETSGLVDTIPLFHTVLIPPYAQRDSSRLSRSKSNSSLTLLFSFLMEIKYL